MELTEFLRFAVGIATALCGLHEKGLMRSGSWVCIFWGPPYAETKVDSYAQNSTVARRSFK
jgi:hypothetical protein